jgi:hypothetical protein
MRTDISSVNELVVILNLNVAHVSVDSSCLFCLPIFAAVNELLLAGLYKKWKFYYLPNANYLLFVHTSV